MKKGAACIISLIVLTFISGCVQQQEGKVGASVSLTNTPSAQRARTATLVPTFTPTPTPVQPPSTRIASTSTPPKSTPTPSIKQLRISSDIAALARNYPQVDGSTSTHPLQMVLACQIFRVPCIWQYSDELERRIVPDPRYPEAPELVREIIDRVQHHGTHESYVSLINGEADFILVARPPSEDERRAAEEGKVVLDVRAVALDAFVFLVNVENPVASLTLNEVRDIYIGKTSDWIDLGGPSGEIIAFQRERNSGSQELMETLVMKGAPMADISSDFDLMIINMGGMINQISVERLGIGYSVYYYVLFMLPDERVKLVGINGVMPTSDNIANRTYPLTTEVYAVVREDTPRGAAAMLLRDWLLSDEGKAAIAESGYVPIR